jgi:hypothetical protein
MNSLERTLITKTGYDHGWEVVIEDSAEQVVLGSALHHARARVISPLPGSQWVLSIQPKQLHTELERSYPGWYLTDECLGADNEAELGLLLAQTSRLARALPDEPCRRFAKAVAEELSPNNTTTTATEIERLVRQRVGQDIYRDSLMDYWGGACAVTGITVPALLRASHAKAWSECTSDSERLNVFNGFLLNAHLDALFDRHLMTFDEAGNAIFAPVIDPPLRTQLGLSGPVKLRWLSPEHLPFLRWHQERFDNAMTAKASSGCC